MTNYFKNVKTNKFQPKWGENSASELTCPQLSLLRHKRCVRTEKEEKRLPCSVLPIFPHAYLIHASLVNNICEMNTAGNESGFKKEILLTWRQLLWNHVILQQGVTSGISVNGVLLFQSIGQKQIGHVWFELSFKLTPWVGRCIRQKELQ